MVFGPKEAKAFRSVVLPGQIASPPGSPLGKKTDSSSVVESRFRKAEELGSWPPWEKSRYVEDDGTCQRRRLVSTGPSFGAPSYRAPDADADSGARSTFVPGPGNRRMVSASLPSSRRSSAAADSIQGASAQLAKAAAQLALMNPRDEDVEMLIARCLTNERPKLLVQMSNAALAKCLLRLGFTPGPEDSKSVLIKKMLSETDRLRRCHADMVEAGSTGLSLEDSDSNSGSQCAGALPDIAAC